MSKKQTRPSVLKDLSIQENDIVLFGQLFVQQAPEPQIELCCLAYSACEHKNQKETAHNEFLSSTLMLKRKKEKAI